MARPLIWLPCLALAAMSVAWAVASWQQTGHQARAGYSLSRGQRVVRVSPGSPAERAGIRAGDRIVRIDGIATHDRAAVARLSQGQPGDTLRLELQRGEQALQREVILQGLTTRERWRRYAAIFTGLAFVGICGGAFLRRPCLATGVLALMGLGMGLAFLGNPWSEPEALRLSVGLLRNAMILAGIGAGLHFLRLMTTPPGGRRAPDALIYLPLLLFWLLLAVRMLSADDTPMLVRRFVSVSGGILFGAYLAIAIATLARAWIRSRGDSALRILCLGAALALAPVGLAALLPVLAPTLQVPARDFWFLALILLPLSWAHAAVAPPNSQT